MITPVEIDIITKLVIAAFLGGIVGFEREINNHPAGLRVHALLCIGSALFTLLTISSSTDVIVQPGIFGGIIMGIGFLAGGIVFRTDNKVHGLTIAAEMWVMAAVGIAVGVGMYYAAFATVLVVLVILVPLKKVEREEHLSKPLKRKK